MTFQRRLEVWAGAAVFLILWTADLAALCPTFYWRDAPEFNDVVATLGIPHPAGSPVYVLLARFLTYLPLGSLAVRVNLASSFWHAVAGVVVMICSLELMKTLRMTDKSEWLNVAAAFLAALTIGLSPSLWSVATFAEVYTMNAGFLGLMTACALIWWRTRDQRWLYAGAWIYGLSAGVHATVVFYLPAWIWMFASTVPAGKRWTGFCRISFFFLLGFSSYLYLPVRSVANPPFDWGNPQTFAQFIIHITDRKTQSAHFDVNAQSFTHGYGLRYLQHLMREMGWLAVIFAVLGFAAHACRERRLLAVLTLLFTGNVIFYLNWKTGDGFIPSNLILSLWTAVGFAVCLQWLSKWRPKDLFAGVQWHRIGALILFLAVLDRPFLATSATVPSAFRFADKSDFYNAYDSARREFDKMPNGSMVITTLFWFPFRYFQDVEHHRTDLSVVMASDVLAPQYFNPLTAQRFPNLHIPALNPLTTPWHEYMPELINENIGAHEIYYEPQLTLNKPIYKNLVPAGFMFQVKAGKQSVGLPPEVLKNYLDHLRSMLAYEDELQSFSTDPNSREYYMTMLLCSADFLILHGHWAESQFLLTVANELKPGNGTVRYYMAQYDLNFGDIPGALHTLQDLAENEPKFDNPLRLLVNYFMAQGDLQQANFYLSRLQHLKPDDFHVQLQTLEWLWRSGKITEARNLRLSLRSSAETDDDRVLLEQWREILDGSVAS